MHGALVINLPTLRSFQGFLFFNMPYQRSVVGRCTQVHFPGAEKHLTPLCATASHFQTITLTQEFRLSTARVDVATVQKVVRMAQKRFWTLRRAILTTISVLLDDNDDKVVTNSHCSSMDGQCVVQADFESRISVGLIYFKFRQVASNFFPSFLPLTPSQNVWIPSRIRCICQS